MIEKVTVLYWEGCVNTFWSPVCVKTIPMQIFRPVLFLVRDTDGKYWKVRAAKSTFTQRIDIKGQIPVVF